MSAPDVDAFVERHEPRRAASIKLTVLARQLGRHFDQAVEVTGLSRAKFGVIAIVSRFPGATQRTIAEYLEVTEVTAGRLIERLCADGYLERRADPGDRRAHRVHLTDAVKPLLKQVAGIAAEHEACVFGGLSDSDLATLDELLTRIGGNLVATKAGTPEAAIVDAAKPKVARKRAEKATGG